MATYNYWRRMYGKRSQEFIDGVIAGVTTFAVWEDGKQVVGVLRKPLKDEIENIKKGLGED